MAHTVLFVDDDLGVLSALVRRLRKEPFQIRTATSAEEGLAVLARTPIDLVVSDWRMPGMSGTEFLAKVAKEYPDCVRIMLTGEPSLAVAMGAINNGEVYRFLSKPYDADALAAIIRAALQPGPGRPVARAADKDGGEGAARESGPSEAAAFAWALDCIITTDHRGTVLEFNPAAERTFGYSRAATVGRPVAEVFPPCGLRDMLSQGLAALPSAGADGGVRRRQLETAGVRACGAEFAVEVTTIAVCNAGQPIFTNFIRDVSELRAAEAALKKAEAQLRQAQKMEALGRLAGGIAHDFNNVLHVVRGYSDLLLADPQVGGDAREALEQIRAAGERAAALIQQLLTFSREKEVAPTVLDCNRVVHDLGRMLHPLVGRPIDLTVRTASGPLWVLADQGQLEQVVMNLVVNACDAMPEGGRLTVETAREPGEGLGSRGWAVLAVSDTGCGMDDETKARVFEPFFTTKEAGRGTGLGLATVYGIVTRAGGRIQVDTAPGQGTTFRVYLPRVEAAQPSAA
jgi:PAS domain S-box-containing protein